MIDFSNFQIIGYETEYVVSCLAPKYPMRTTDKEAAEAHARKTGRTVQVQQKPIYARVSASASA